MAPDGEHSKLPGFRNGRLSLRARDERNCNLDGWVPDLGRFRGNTSTIT
jgi:hypothetical protein